jgi:hypothetical protein
MSKSGGLRSFVRCLHALSFIQCARGRASVCVCACVFFEDPGSVMKYNLLSSSVDWLCLAVIILLARQSIRDKRTFYVIHYIQYEM